MTLTRRNMVLLAGGLTILAVAGATLWSNQARVPKRFGVVVAGELYRCGDVTPEQLAQLVQSHHIVAVLSLLNATAPQTIAEREAAKRLGIEWYNVPLTGDGASTPADREKIKRILFAERAGPLLVHCSAGTNRTGLTVGLYRICKQGWTFEQVLAEMKDYDFEDEAHHENLREALKSEAAMVAGQSMPAAAGLPRTSSAATAN